MCPYFGMRKIIDQTLNLKRACIATDDETLKNTSITRLAADVLKAKLLYRRLSTTHKKKAQLADRFSLHLLSLNNSFLMNPLVLFQSKN